MARSADLTNLLRRVRRFNKSHPELALNVESIARQSQPSRVAVNIQRLSDRQEIARLNKATEKTRLKTVNLANRYSPLEGIYERIEKNLARGMAKRLESARTQHADAVKAHAEAKEFDKARNRYLTQVRNYNRNLTIRQNSKRMSYLPRNQKELDQMKKVLFAMKKGDEETARKLLNIRSKKSVRTYLRDREERRAKATGDYTYKDHIYYDTSIKNARISSLPELAELFIEGGISLVMALHTAGFTMIEYYDPEKSVDTGGYIMELLEDVIDDLDARSATLVEEFIRKYEDKYW